MDGDFVVTVRRHAGVDVVAVLGDLDIATAPRLLEVTTDPQQCSQPGLVIDLSAVGFLDSTGIGALVTTWRHHVDRASRLGLVCPAGHPRRVVELVQLPQLLQVWDTVDDALEVLALA